MSDENPYEGIASAALDEWGGRGSLPQNLYHYTSAQGLLGIIEKKCVWFSDNAFMNDGSETLYGMSLIREVAEEFFKDKQRSNAANEVIDLLENQRQFQRSIIFCMSEGENMLNQWRDYGKDITAYSIKLESSKLIEKGYNFKAMLIKIIYDRVFHLHSVRRAVENLYEVSNSIDFTKLDQASTIRHQVRAAIELHFLISHFKNPAFEAEREWRLTSFTNVQAKVPTPQFRASSLGVVPYYEWRREHPEEHLPITEIMVGPTPYAQASDMALNLFLQRSGLNVSTRYSTIPIRR